jgi:hydrogenase/urease accessory protein HupE
VLLFGLVTSQGEARAHDVGLSVGDYRVSPGGLTARLTFARREGFPAPKAELVRVFAGEARCKVAVSGDELPVQGDGIEVLLVAECPRGATPSRVELPWLRGKPHTQLVSLHGEGTAAPVDRDVALTGREWSFVVGAGPAPALPDLVGIGAIHIFSGLDHLAFLLGLLLVPVTRRGLLLTLTAFTVGHSLSLLLSSLGVVTLGPRLVEPAIALSVAWIGIENLFRKRFTLRFLLALPFGLLHGLGFANGLRELTSGAVVGPVIAFNVGVELGQVGSLTLFAAFLWMADASPAFRLHGRRVLSIALAVLGLSWAVARVLHAG